jgi:uncharacterized membrane protein
MSHKVSKSKSNKPKQIPKKNNSLLAAATHTEHYSGPIPQPEDLVKYENIQIGFADRIITMTENEAKHRQKSENKIINSERIFNILGQLLGAFLGLSVIGIMVYAFYLGYAEQVQYIGFSIAIVISLFIYKRK